MTNKKQSETSLTFSKSPVEVLLYGLSTCISIFKCLFGCKHLLCKTFIARKSTIANLDTGTLDDTLANNHNPTQNIPLTLKYSKANDNSLYE